MGSLQKAFIPSVFTLLLACSAQKPGSDAIQPSVHDEPSEQQVYLDASVSQLSGVFTPPSYLSEGPVFIRNVRVIDGLGGPPVPDRDILIEDGKISQIGKGLTSPPSAYVIEGEGLTVLPGLIDMHVHIWPLDYSDPNINKFASGKPVSQADIQKPLDAFLYAGVTRVFDMGNDHEFIFQLRDDVATEKRAGPVIHASGAIIQRLQSVNNDVMELMNPDTQAEIKALLDEREAAGVHMVKLYAGLSTWSTRHISDQAHKRGMKVVGDFWCSNLTRSVLDVGGLDGSAHGGCYVIDEDFARWMHDNDRFVIMTFSVFENFSRRRVREDIKTRAYLKNPLIVDVLGRDMLEDYYSSYDAIEAAYYTPPGGLYPAQLFGDVEPTLEYNFENLRILQEAGVLIGTGTDSAFPPGTFAGESMHRELELMVEAGLEPTEAIKLATYNNAVILDLEDEVGRIDFGKSADLFIVRGNPAENISATRDIVYVIKSGKVLDREALMSR